ncbi:hypothetical protein [Chachezhania sediminis]|uniref:hypothetical protein n=1 Tax=Chachezhania sediminis TaxID=2599291 RepID=UPI00131BE223|nr:hypothetical protein [Chachezhania sediminis]
MNIFGFKVLAAIAALAAGPAMASDYLRDSDGDVLSNLGKPWVLDANMPVVMYRMETVGGSPVTFSAQSDSVKVGAATYAVERTGGAVYLRDSVTGSRIAATRVAGGKAVNPTSFGLD